MAQIFPASSNTVARASVIGLAGLLGGVAWAWNAFYWSSYETRVKVPVEQPVPFSHKHHVAGLGIDCRYCHTSVESSAFAGMPSTETCMSCHSQIWPDAPMLAPVRESFATGTRLRWNRVHDLPDFVYFDHSIHVARQIGCSTCHGDVGEMPLVWKEQTLYMKWCLECHRQPEGFLRASRGEVFLAQWRPSADQAAKGGKVARTFHIDTRQITNCGVCHR
jgi:hypothetical protein